MGFLRNIGVCKIVERPHTFIYIYIYKRMQIRGNLVA